MYASNFSFPLFFFLFKKLQNFKIAYTINYIPCYLSHLPWHLFSLFLYFRWIRLPDSSFVSNICPVAYFLLLYSLHFSHSVFACLEDWHWMGALEKTCQKLAFSLFLLWGNLVFEHASSWSYTEFFSSVIFFPSCPLFFEKIIWCRELGSQHGLQLFGRLYMITVHKWMLKNKNLLRKRS